MNFFCTKEHLKDYQARMSLGDEHVICLDALEALEAARILFSP